MSQRHQQGALAAVLADEGDRAQHGGRVSVACRLGAWQGVLARAPSERAGAAHTLPAADIAGLPIYTIGCGHTVSQLGALRSCRTPQKPSSSEHALHGKLEKHDVVSRTCQIQVGLNLDG